MILMAVFKTDYIYTYIYMQNWKCTLNYVASSSTVQIIQHPSKLHASSHYGPLQKLRC